ncbi:hypothetical protein IQ07DRAFT_38511 [Pyrenochaeta sp. DS3sAY3a]|nr:hypothetical protein IQ07DRAFT_38511 [Pyrenochaeta sp. DS3sAY3a]
MAPDNHRVYAPIGWPGPSLPDNISIEDLPISSPYCVDERCRAYREGFALDETKTPLVPLLRYSYWTVWFYTIWLLLFTAIYASHRIHDHFAPRPKHSSHRPSLTDKATALLRAYTYRRPNTRFTRALGLRQISHGTLALLAFSTLFLAILPWPQGHFLRARFRFGSPPLSIRCAMLISALTPLSVALAGKVNVITWMTGVGYERLNVLHRYTAYAIFVLGTVHTIPHLYAPVQDGGWSMLNKLYANQKRELSGTPLYAAMFGLTFFSVPWVRRRCYEGFKYVHFVLAGVYLACFFWHAYGNFCPNYIYATIAVLLFSNILRFTQRHRNLRSLSSLTGFPTRLEYLHANVVRVSVQVPRSFTWKPGQHAFLCVPSLSVVQSHPFTIANVPVLEKEGETHEMIFLVRGHRGFTRTLLKECERRDGDESTMAELNMDVDGEKAFEGDPQRGLSVNTGSTSPTVTGKPQTTHLEISSPSTSHSSPTLPRPLLRTIIDGPYGTHTRPLHKLYDTVLLIAGGSGITACIPHILDLSHRVSQHEPIATQRIHLVWAIRDAACFSWVERELSVAARWTRSHGSSATPPIEFTVDVYLTRARGLAESPGASETELSAATPTSPISPVSPLGEVQTLRFFDAAVEKTSYTLPAMPRPVLHLQRADSGHTSTTTRTPRLPPIDTTGLSVHSPTSLSSPAHVPITLHHCRPVIRDVVEKKVTGHRAMVMACGPADLMCDVANAVAGVQRRVWRGEAGMAEVAVRLGGFGV